MGVKVRKRNGKWYVVIDYHGRRKSKCVGTREAAEKVKREVEARLALGDVGVLKDEKEHALLTFNEYSGKWMKRYAEVECKFSTMYGYRLLLKRHLVPEFGQLALGRVSREHVKDFAARLAGMGLSRNSVRRVISLLAEILNAALDDGLIDRNPATRILRSRKDKEEKFRPSPLTPEEQTKLLNAARAHSLERYALFLVALRTGLRRGEVVALQWGDIQFGADDADLGKFIEVRRNYVYCRFTTPKSHKSRRVDMSPELHRTLLELRDACLLRAFTEGKPNIAEEFVFPSPSGGVLNPDTMFKDWFLPTLEAAGIRAVRFHDLRHTFGARLIAAGAPLNYVKEQLGHASIQITVDTYGHLIPGVGERYVDRLDAETSPQQSATRTQPERPAREKESPEVVEIVGSGGEDRTPDLGIMRPSLYH